MAGKLEIHSADNDEVTSNDFNDIGTKKIKITLYMFKKARVDRFFVFYKQFLREF